MKDKQTKWNETKQQFNLTIQQKTTFCLCVWWVSWLVLVEWNGVVCLSVCCFLHKKDWKSFLITEWWVIDEEPNKPANSSPSTQPLISFYFIKFLFIGRLMFDYLELFFISGFDNRDKDNNRKSLKWSPTFIFM